MLHFEVAFSARRSHGSLLFLVVLLNPFNPEAKAKEGYVKDSGPSPINTELLFYHTTHIGMDQHQPTTIGR